VRRLIYAQRKTAAVDGFVGYEIQPAVFEPGIETIFTDAAAASRTRRA
jgi:hypothetical protein